MPMQMTSAAAASTLSVTGMSTAATSHTATPASVPIPSCGPFETATAAW